MNNKNRVWMDLLFYIVIPYLIWNQGKDIIGDYYAILLSTAPAFFYTIFTFVKEKQFNVTGLFLVITLLLKTIVDLISGNAETMLMNQVYFMIASGLFLIMTIFINKPLTLYFFVDTAYLMGYKREDSRKLFHEKDIFPMFKWLTLLFAARYFALAVVKYWLLQKYGVEGYGTMIVFRQGVTWAFSLVIGIGTYMVFKKIQDKTGFGDATDTPMDKQ
ncbi:VC0807 family protein [Bacillus sp. CGMCC 1.16541]|uniref:VC0807 family protein n=1 Tax=Bacillus sp. CGMCC 1.16541 TaxID=2185143 RepID=UPI000D7361E6|nr:VC0807 family protein [Bacillus sp. CGMCC 1.16541]